MATLLYTFLGITAGASLHCVVRREISPCTCAPHDVLSNTIQVNCDRMESFSQVVDALQDRFAPESKIWLSITHSQLDDLSTRTFSELNMNLKNLKLNQNNLSSLPVSTFRGLTKTEFLSLSDTMLEEVPRNIFDHMPNVGTITFLRSKIRQIKTHDFKALPNLGHLVLASNQLSYLEAESFPSSMVTLHIGKNNLNTLNGTIRNLPNLRILYINSNNISSLEGELPPNSHNLMMILAQNNSIDKLPSGLKNLPNLDSLFFNNNQLTTLGGQLKHSKKLQLLYVENNRLEYLADDEFEDTEIIEKLEMGFNYLKSLNGSLLSIKHLQYANFTHNLLEEFSFKEISGLHKLRSLDLSHNNIVRLSSGRSENQIKPNSYIVELRLEHNSLKSLDGALMGLNELQVLSLGHNKIEKIAPDDFIGLEKLRFLDISFNQLKTLMETSKTYLPSLSTLNASYNLLTALEHDFHGLPVLCEVDLSNNMISTISTEVVAHTRCMNHGVQSKLEIILQENPVLCDEYLAELITAMEYQEARLLGVAHCLVPQMMDHPILLPQQPLVIQTQIPIINPNPVMNPPPSIVQVFVPIPAPLISAPQPLTQEPQSNLSEADREVIQIDQNQQITSLTTMNPIQILLSTPATPIDPITIDTSLSSSYTSTISSLTEDIDIPIEEIQLQDEIINKNNNIVEDEINSSLSNTILSFEELQQQKPQTKSLFSGDIAERLIEAPVEQEQELTKTLPEILEPPEDNHPVEE